MTTDESVQSGDTETQTQEAETSTEDGAASQETADTDAKVAELESKLKASEEAREKLYARLKREGSKDGEASKADKTEQKADTAAPALSREEGILFSKGFSEEEVEQAKKVATLQGVKLIEAVNDDLFTGWKAKRDKEVKDRAAQLGPSKGGKPTTKKTFTTSGLSEEDHKALFNEKLGR